MVDKFFHGEMDFIMLVGKTHQRLTKEKANDRSSNITCRSNIYKLTHEHLESHFAERNIILGERRDFAIGQCVKIYKEKIVYVPKCRRRKPGPKDLLQPGQLATIIENVRIQYSPFLLSSALLKAALTEESLRELVKGVDPKYDERRAVKKHYSRFYINTTLKTNILEAILPAVVSPEYEPTSSASAMKTPSSPVRLLGRETLDKKSTHNSSDNSSDEHSGSEDGGDSGSEDGGDSGRGYELMVG